MNFTSFDGKIINVYEWADVEEPKGVVQIVHGMTEHALRYEQFAKKLNSLGYVVVADDHRGHGKTDRPTLGYCQGNMFADTLKDEGAITDYFKAKYAGLKYLVFGFSYGSFITQAYLAKFGRNIDAAIIGGSNYKKDFEVYLGSFVAAVGAAFCGERAPAKLIERLSFGAYSKHFEDGEWLSADQGNNEMYHGDELCGFTCSFRFYADFFKGLRSLYTNSYIKALPQGLPVLLVSGEDDPVGEMGKGVKKLYRFYTEKAGMKNVELVLFPHSRHEFLNEKQDREEKWGAVIGFIQKHLTAPERTEEEPVSADHCASGLEDFLE